MHPCKTFKETGNLHELVAAVASPCRVVLTGPADVAARAADRSGGANWYPSQYPTPAGPLSPVGRADWHGIGEG